MDEVGVEKTMILTMSTGSAKLLAAR